MSRFHSYLNSAAAILRQYDGREPFAAFLKKYFAAYKKFGSGDRKQISQLCYCYFRTGKAFAGMPAEEKILAGLFLCSNQPQPVLEALKPEWNAETRMSIREKARLTGEEHLPEKIFPFTAALSEGIVAETFALSHLIQPQFFLRVRPGKEKSVAEKLAAAGIPFQAINPRCLQLPAAAKIDNVLETDRDAVVQDYSSQRLGEFLERVPAGYRNRLWDACAASGGKSILAADLFEGAEITATDIRESILANLRKRFARAGITRFHVRQADLSRPFAFSKKEQFPLLLADVPCSGSGTWGRTPEQLVYFSEEKIAEYTALQGAILKNILPGLQPGGYLLYSTCSVFKAENEDRIQLLQEQDALELIHSEVLKGYDLQADTMFAALLRRPG